MVVVVVVVEMAVVVPWQFSANQLPCKIDLHEI